MTPAWIFPVYNFLMVVFKFLYFVEEGGGNGGPGSGWEKPVMMGGVGGFPFSKPAPVGKDGRKAMKRLLCCLTVGLVLAASQSFAVGGWGYVPAPKGSLCQIQINNLASSGSIRRGRDIVWSGTILGGTEDWGKGAAFLCAGFTNNKTKERYTAGVKIWDAEWSHLMAPNKIAMSTKTKVMSFIPPGTYTVRFSIESSKDFGRKTGGWKKCYPNGYVTELTNITIK